MVASVLVVFRNSSFASIATPGRRRDEIDGNRAEKRLL